MEILKLVWWYLIVLLIGWAAWPLTAFLFPAFKDKGYAFTRTLGLLLSGFFFWILADFRILQNDAGGVLTAVLLTWMVSLGLQRTGRVESYKQLAASSRKNILWSEGLFLVCFVAIACWRAANPDISGTEKPMELAFINAILRSPTFPPADPWLSGYSISYYYFGYVIISMLIRLSGVSSGIAFNLAAATIFSLTATGLYGLLFNLVNAPRMTTWLHRGKPVSEDSYGLPLLAPLFTLVVSNFEGLFEIFYAKGWFWQKAADGNWVSPFWNWVNLQELQAYPTQPLGWWPQRSGGIIWWRASRVLADYKLTGEFQEVIDEFPFFSFLLSDLHPHVLALPFDTLALAFGLNLLLGGAPGKVSLGGFTLHLPLRYLLTVPVFIGGMAFMNTWDFPVQLGIFLLCYLAMRIAEDGWHWERLWDLIGSGILLGGLSCLCYLPFFIGFKSQAGGIVPSFIFYTRGIQQWMMFGTLLIPMLTFLFHITGKNARRQDWKQGAIWASVLVFGAWLLSFLLADVALNLSGLGQNLSGSSSPAWASLGKTLVEAETQFRYAQGLTGETTASAVGAALANRFRYPGAWITLWVIFFLGFTLASVWIGQRREDSESDQGKLTPNDSRLPEGWVFVLILALSGALVVLVPEFIYLRDQFGNRMNTIFKFYYQGWLLWSLTASFAVIYILHRMEGAARGVSEALTVLAVAAGLIYPVIGISATTHNLHPDKLDLNGNAYLAAYQPDEAQAMGWLSMAPYGVIAESVGGSYSAHARMSTHSGLPAVIGWTPHEGQWGRTYLEMGARDPDIQTLYSTPDWFEAKSILDKYQIRYVVIGYLERSTYPQLYENKFSQNLAVVFRNNSVTIYEYSGSVYEKQ